MIYAVEGESSTKSVPVSAQERASFILSEEEIIRLAQWGVKDRGTLLEESRRLQAHGY